MNESTPSPKRHLVIPIVVVIAVLAVIGSLIAVSTKKTSSVVATASSSPTVSASASPSASAAATATATTSTSVYKDGTYTASGSYNSPGGSQSVAVKLTLAGDVVTAAELTENATDRESQEYQDRFASGYKSLVVGKKIAAISLSRVSGSSLTSKGFNAAVTQIKSEAKA